jgi:hypothetical protein
LGHIGTQKPDGFVTYLFYFQHCLIDLLNKSKIGWLMYTIIILHQLSIDTSMKHSLLQTFETGLAPQSLDTLSDVRIKGFTLLF